MRFRIMAAGGTDESLGRVQRRVAENGGLLLRDVMEVKLEFDRDRREPSAWTNGNVLGPLDTRDGLATVVDGGFDGRDTLSVPLRTGRVSRGVTTHSEWCGDSDGPVSPPTVGGASAPPEEASTQRQRDGDVHNPRPTNSGQ